MPDLSPAPAGLFKDDHQTLRCVWCRATPEYQRYHDTEWGFPVHDDTRLFEKICLEGFQAGLSWLTILNKREGFRQAFEGFDIDRVAALGEADIARLLLNPGIVRHRDKIASLSLQGLTTSAESVALSKDLKKRGWSFVGPTTMYAFMQAMGLVNDHLEGCHARPLSLARRAALD